MDNVLRLKDILSLGGKVILCKNQKTNFVSLNKLLKKENVDLSKEEIYFCYLTYSQTFKIQAVYIVDNPDDENCVLKEVYNKLNDI